MRSNIFEGWRRITRIVQAIACLIAGIITYEGMPKYVEATYITFGPESNFQLDDVNLCKDYSSNTAKEYSIYRTIASGLKVNTTLCFVAMRFDDGRHLIPFKADEKKSGYVYGNEKYSTQVQSYIKSRAAYFSIPEKDEKELQKAFHEKQREARFNIFYAVGGTFLVLQILAFAVGWVVRGFLGIHHGLDYRHPSGDSAPND